MSEDKKVQKANMNVVKDEETKVENINNTGVDPKEDVNTTVTNIIKNMTKELIDKLGSDIGLFIVVDVAGIGSTVSGNAPKVISIGILEEVKHNILNGNINGMQ